MKVGLARVGKKKFQFFQRWQKCGLESFVPGTRISGTIHVVLSRKFGGILFTNIFEPPRAVSKFWKISQSFSGRKFEKEEDEKVR